MRSHPITMYMVVLQPRQNGFKFYFWMKSECAFLGTICILQPFSDCIFQFFCKEVTILAHSEPWMCTFCHGWGSYVSKPWKFHVVSNFFHHSTRIAIIEFFSVDATTLTNKLFFSRKMIFFFIISKNDSVVQERRNPKLQPMKTRPWVIIPIQKQTKWQRRSCHHHPTIIKLNEVKTVHPSDLSGPIDVSKTLSQSPNHRREHLIPNGDQEEGPLPPNLTMRPCKSVICTLP